MHLLRSLRLTDEELVKRWRMLAATVNDAPSPPDVHVYVGPEMGPHVAGVYRDRRHPDMVFITWGAADETEQLWSHLTPAVVTVYKLSLRTPFMIRDTEVVEHDVTVRRTPWVSAAVELGRRFRLATHTNLLTPEVGELDVVLERLSNTQPYLQRGVLR